MPLTPERRAQQRAYWHRKGKRRRADRECREGPADHQARRERQQRAVELSNADVIALYRAEKAKRIEQGKPVLQRRSA